VRTPADLRRTFLSLDHVFFSDLCAHAGVRCRWKKFRSAKNSFQFGEYDEDRKIVSLNVRLAQDDVPDYVVSAVCYHEMLHHMVGLEHTVAFARAEHQHPYFYASETWADQFVLEMLDGAV